MRVLTHKVQVGCPNCALRICSSFAEWARIRRLTVVPHGSSPPPYELWGDADESDASRILRALDVVKCGEQRATDDSHEVRRVAAGFVGAGKGKGVWVERQERNWVYLRIVGLSPSACLRRRTKPKTRASRTRAPRRFSPSCTQPTRPSSAPRTNPQPLYRPLRPHPTPHSGSPATAPAPADPACATSHGRQTHTRSRSTRASSSAPLSLTSHSSARSKRP